MAADGRWSVNTKTPAERRQAMLASSLDVEPGSTGWTPLRNEYSEPLYVLIALFSLVLLVACANVANLLLARSTARRHEIAVRRAVGAGRGRIVRRLLSEGLLLALMGAAAGLLVAQFGSVLLLRLASSEPHPIALSVGLTRQVLIFTMVVAVLAEILFALAPAVRAASVGPSLDLKEGGRLSLKSSGGLARALAAAQAWSLLLLIGAGLSFGTFEIRANGSLGGVSSAVEGVVGRLLPGVPVRTRSFTAQVEDSIRSEILMAKLAGVFGGLALVLSFLGVYGLLAYIVAWRTREIAVRMALGAQKIDVLGMVVAQGLRLTLAGAMVGIVGALGLMRFLSSLLYGVKPTDPLTFVAVSLILVAVARVACYIPARRATKADPMVALRCE